MNDSVLFYIGHEVAVAVAIVDAADGRPEFVGADPVERESGLGAAVGVRPGIGAHFVFGVWGHPDGIVFLVECTGFDGFALGHDGLEGLHEAVEFAERFAFGGLDHQGLVDREGEGRGVEAEVHEALGHVSGIDAVSGFEIAQVEDALVGDAPCGARIEGLEFRQELGRHVVGVEDGDLGDFAEAFCAEHLDVGVGDGQEQRASIRSRTHGVHTVAAAFADHRVAGQVGFQRCGTADGADARTAAAVRHGEGLVEVEVAYIRADVTRIGEAHLGVHVGAVHVEEAAVAVDDVHNLADTDLEYAVRRRIGDHHAGQPVAGSGSFFGQFFHIDVAVVVATDQDDLVAGHRGGCRVGAMGGGRDDHDAAVGSAVGVEVASDGHQASIFAGRAAVRLQGAAVEAGDDGQVVLQFMDYLQRALRLVGRGVRVQVAELAPAERKHLGGGVELHGAAAQRNHGVGERDVLALQHLDVAHHLGLGVVGIEDLLRKDGGFALHETGFGGEGRAAFRAAEDLADGAGLFAAGKFVEGDLHGASIGIPEVETSSQGFFADGGGIDVHDADGVEEVLGSELIACLTKFSGHGVGEAPSVAGDLGDALRAVPHGEHAGHGGHKGRGGADVRGGFFALDMLLAGLEGQTDGAFAEAAYRDADDAARQVSFVFVGAGHPTGGRAAEAHGEAEALGGTAGDVGTPGSGFLQHGEGEQVAPGGHQASGGVGAGAEVRVVADFAIGGGVLDQGAVAVRFKGIVKCLSGMDLNAQAGSAGTQHRQYVREDVLIDEDHVLAGFHGIAGPELEHHAHRLGSCRGVVEHRAIGEREAGERGDHRLEVDECLEASLRDLGLVRGVGGVPARVLKNVAGDDGGGGGAVEAQADERAEIAVLAGNLLEAGQVGLLADGGIEFQGLLQEDILGNGLLDEFFERGNAQHFEHLLLLGRPRAVVSVNKGKRHIAMGLLRIVVK